MPRGGRSARRPVSDSISIGREGNQAHLDSVGITVEVRFLRRQNDWQREIKGPLNGTDFTEDVESVKLTLVRERPRELDCVTDVLKSSRQ